MFPHQPTAFKNKNCTEGLHADHLPTHSLFFFSLYEPRAHTQMVCHYPFSKRHRKQWLDKCRAGVRSGNFSNNHHSSRHPVLHTLTRVQRSCWRQEFQTWRWSAIERGIDTGNLSTLFLSINVKNEGNNVLSCPYLSYLSVQKNKVWVSGTHVLRPRKVFVTQELIPLVLGRPGNP